MELEEHRREKTDMYCHECSKNFVAVLDYGIEGNHEIHCPWCGHHHYRVIVNGRVTEDRYNSDHQKHVVGRRQVWKSAVQPIMTTTASHFIRERWLDKMR